jgi:hypothetical protein
MKTIRLTLIFGVLFSAFTAYSQEKQVATKFATFEESKARISESGKSFPAAYRAQRKLCGSKATNLEGALSVGVSESINSTAIELALCSKELGRMREQFVAVWMNVYRAYEMPDLLISDGWNQNQITEAMTWSKKFWEIARQLNKIDGEYTTDNQINSLLLRSGAIQYQ